MILPSEALKALRREYQKHLKRYKRREARAFKEGTSARYGLARHTHLYQLDTQIKRIRVALRMLETFDKYQREYDGEVPENKTAGRNRSGLTNGKNNGL